VSRWAALGIALALVGSASAAFGQASAGRCDLQFRTSASANTRITVNKLPSGQYNSFLGGGVDAFCAGQDVTLRADSAESYGQANVLYLIGNVHYTEPRVRVDSRRMTYFRSEERLLAEGDVNAVLPSGTTMRGPQAEYFRAVPVIRPRARLAAPGRPDIQLIQADSAGRPGEPVHVVADRVVMDGDSLVYASGRVEITRTDVDARGDSAFLDGSREFARLMRGPSITGKGERPFTLNGSVIDLYSSRRLLQRVVAARDAKAVSGELNLTADTIDLRVQANRLQRAFAWGASRARAKSPDRDLVADSLDVVMPDQRLREVRAVRNALAETLPDTSKIRSGERDWLRGDTILAYFDTAAVRDTAARPRLRELVARGRASSRYQVESEQGGPQHPSINYVRGRQITVAMNTDDQAVRTVNVLDQVAGLFLEPAAPPADSGAAAPAAARPPGATSGGTTPAGATLPRGGTPATRPPAGARSSIPAGTSTPPANVPSRPTPPGGTPTPAKPPAGTR
jgi:lipopolysaccharide export system protein LptA